MIKVVGFDLDNTLYDQTCFEFKIFKKISKIVSLEYNISESKFFNSLKSLYLKNEKEYLFDKACIQANSCLPLNWESFIIKKVLPTYRKYDKFIELSLYEGIEEELINLKKNNFDLVLITNGNSEVQNNKIEALNIREYFDLILISDDFEPKRRKPDTFMFKEALKFFSVSETEIVFVGDDLIRDKACEKVGIKFIDIKTYEDSKLGEIYGE